MTLTREVYRSTWMTPVAGETSRAAAPKPRKPRNKKPRKRHLTPEQERRLMKAVALRDKLTNKALAQLFGLKYCTLLDEIHLLRRGE